VPTVSVNVIYASSHTDMHCIQIVSITHTHTHTYIYIYIYIYIERERERELPVMYNSVMFNMQMLSLADSMK